MSGTRARIVLIRERDSGTFHKAFRDVAGVDFMCTCPVEEFGGWDEVPWSALDTAEPDALCLRCLPPGMERSGVEYSEADE